MEADAGDFGLSVKKDEVGIVQKAGGLKGEIPVEEAGFSFGFWVLGLEFAGEGAVLHQKANVDV